MDTSNLKETLDKIDEVILRKKEAINRGEKLKRLMANSDFNYVILEGYKNVEAERLFKILTDPTGSSPISPEAVQMKLASISDFKGYVGTDDYLGTVMIEAMQAPDEILREEAYRKEVTATFSEDKD